MSNVNSGDEFRYTTRQPALTYGELTSDRVAVAWMETYEAAKSGLIGSANRLLAHSRIFLRNNPNAPVPPDLIDDLTALDALSKLVIQFDELAIVRARDLCILMGRKYPRISEHSTGADP